MIGIIAAQGPILDSRKKGRLNEQAAQV